MKLLPLETLPKKMVHLLCGKYSTWCVNYSKCNFVETHSLHTLLPPLEAQPWGRVTDTEEAKCLSSLCLQSPVVKHRKPIWRACIFPSKKKNNNTARLWGQARATSCISKRHEKCILSGCNPDLTCVPFALEGRRYRRQSAFTHPMDLPFVSIQHQGPVPAPQQRSLLPSGAVLQSS